MKDVFLLTKVLMKSSKAQNDSKGSKFKKYFLILFAFAYLMGFMGYTSYETINALVTFKIEYLFIKLMLMGMFTFFIMQTIIASLNVLFFSKDIETLLPLPIKPNKIVMAKMNTLIISEYLTGLMILAPALVVYGYTLKLGISYYILAICAFLLLPIIPVIIMSFVVSAIMKMTNIIRNKNIVQYLSILLTLILVFAIEMLSGSTNENVSSQDIANSVTSINSVFNEYSVLYIPVKPIYEMIINHNNINGIYNLGMITVVSCVIYLIGSNIISNIYLKVVTSLNKTSKKKKSGAIEYKKDTVRKTFLKRDFKIIYRNPNFLLQCLIMPFLMTSVIASSVAMSIKDIPLQDIEFIKGYINEGYPLAIMIGIIGVLYTFNFISITAYSRDGQNAKVLKYLPVSFDKQIKYKTLLGFYINLVLMIIVLIGIKILVPTLSIVNLLILAFIGTLINIFNNYLGILLDLKNPKLNWTSEQAVVKQNLNMFVQMGLLSIQIGAIIYLGYKLQNLNKIAIIVTITYIALLLLLKVYIKNNAKKLYSRID